MKTKSSTTTHSKKLAKTSKVRHSRLNKSKEPTSVSGTSSRLSTGKEENKQDGGGQIVRAIDRQVGGSHYKDLAIQPIEYCQKNKLGACESFVVKYVTRHESKGGKADLEKAIHCIQLLIEMKYPDPPAQLTESKSDVWDWIASKS